MATRRTTSDKRQRERAKQAKAAAKRARRQARAGDTDTTATTVGDDDGVGVGDGVTTEQLLQRIETLHARFDAGSISFDEFDAQKTELLDRVAIRLADDRT